MKNTTKAEITAALRSSLEAKFWKLRRIANLPEVFVRDGDVTPYFACENVRSSRGVGFVVEGSVGVIWHEFESAWDSCHEVSKAGSGLAISLHLANFRELIEKRRIPVDNWQHPLESLCVCIAGVLNSMPDSANSLCIAFQSGSLAGTPIQNFSGYSYRNKFAALQKHALERGAILGTFEAKSVPTAK